MLLKFFLTGYLKIILLMIVFLVPGNALPLISVVKVLFSHVWDVLSTTPCFQSEYGIIIRHLVAVRDYRFHLRKRIYCSKFCHYFNLRNVYYYVVCSMLNFTSTIKYDLDCYMMFNFILTLSLPCGKISCFCTWRRWKEV